MTFLFFFIKPDDEITLVKREKDDDKKDIYDQESVIYIYVCGW